MNFHKDRYHLRELQLGTNPLTISSAPYIQTQYGQFPAALHPTHPQGHTQRPRKQTTVFFSSTNIFSASRAAHCSARGLNCRRPSSESINKTGTRHSLSKATRAGCTLNMGTIVQLVHVSGLITCTTATNYPIEIS